MLRELTTIEVVTNPFAARAAVLRELTTIEGVANPLPLWFIVTLVFIVGAVLSNPVAWIYDQYVVPTLESESNARALLIVAVLPDTFIMVKTTD